MNCPCPACTEPRAFRARHSKGSVVAVMPLLGDWISRQVYGIASDGDD